MNRISSIFFIFLRNVISSFFLFSFFSFLLLLCVCVCFFGGGVLIDDALFGFIDLIKVDEMSG